VDHVALFRWVQRFTPEIVEAEHPCILPAIGSRSR
jgi:hypothetical protein